MDRVRRDTSDKNTSGYQEVFEANSPEEENLLNTLKELNLPSWKLSKILNAYMDIAVA